MPESLTGDGKQHRAKIAAITVGASGSANVWKKKE